MDDPRPLHPSAETASETSPQTTAGSRDTVRIAWLRHDLRWHDNPVLAEAARDGAPLIVLFTLSPRWHEGGMFGLPKLGAHRARFLLESLADLRATLRARGGELAVRLGDAAISIAQLSAAHGVGEVLWRSEVGIEERREEAAVAAALARAGVRTKRIHGGSLHHRDDLPFAPDDMPAVFTTFRQAVERHAPVRAEIAMPERLPAPPAGLDAGVLPGLTDLAVDPPRDDPRAVMRFRGGESAGLARLEDWMWHADALRRYKHTRNGMLARDDSSKLSPWLALGCLSPQRVFHEVARYERERVANEDTYWLVFELRWRDFFRFAADRDGASLFRPGGPAERDRRWSRDPARFEAWRKGATGIPVVDANLRELASSGWMSNRGRQLVASYLAKELGLDWRMGAAWFETHLLDYDVASNWGNWAYVAGVGADPRDRRFNMVGQAQRYDPEGAYVRQWLPELARVPDALVHTPWRMGPLERLAVGFELGRDYPAPRTQR
jgi:deoxyribodipyrimidine photo-lyase